MTKKDREYLCARLAKDLGENQIDMYFRIYRVKRTLKNLVELYISVKGEQAFVESYLNVDSLYVENKGHLERFCLPDGTVTILHNNNVVAQGQI